MASSSAAKATPSLQIQIPQSEGSTGDVASANDDEFSYCDIMMLGRTGFGKSTVGNKLLGIDPETNVPYEKDTKIKQLGYDSDGQYFFETGDGTDSVTKKCKVLSNDTTRVIDTRGFADSEMTQKYGVIQGNLQSFRWILQAQRAHDLRFARVLYFFPKRGPAERADGTLQEEIKVMYGYFGQKIFDIMVIVVTNYKREYYQKAGFCQEDIDTTQAVFKAAFNKVVADEQQDGTAPNTTTVQCPPVVYIPLNEDHKKVFKSVIGADVISDAEMFVFSPEYPKNPEFRREPSSSSQLSLKYETPYEEKKKAFQQNRGKQFSFEDRCTRCAIKLVYERHESGEELPVRVILPSGQEDVYDLSHCHPQFIPKFTIFKRIAGGIVYVITLGIVKKLYEYVTKNKSWPIFMSSEEVCIKCKEPPGSDSCHPVNQWFEIGAQAIKVDHSRELDTVKLLVEDGAE